MKEEQIDINAFGIFNYLGQKHNAQHLPID